MINEFMKFLDKHDVTDEYVGLVSQNKKDPAEWMNIAAPWGYIYNAFKFNEFEPEAKAKWGRLHREWYRICKQRPSA